MTNLRLYPQVEQLTTPKLSSFGYADFIDLNETELFMAALGQCFKLIAINYGSLHAVSVCFCLPQKLTQLHIFIKVCC